MGEGHIFSAFSWENNHTDEEFEQYLHVATDVHFKKEIFTFHNEVTYRLVRMVFKYLEISFPTEYFKQLLRIGEIDSNTV